MAIMIMLKKRNRKELKMNFSVGVNMYKENVTSYWYLFRWSHRNVDANMDIVASDARGFVASSFFDGELFNVRGALKFKGS